MEQALPEICKSLKKYSKLTNHINLPISHEYWNPLQFACSIGDLETVKYLIETKSADVESIPNGKVVPRMTPVHICSMYGHTDILVQILSSTNVDLQDQWGFTALHYAVSSRKLQSVQVLLDFGANASLSSASGTSPLQLAQELGYQDIADLLASKVSIAEDPAAPQFREWLRSLGAGAYVSAFFKAGYDLTFVASHGLSDEDCDCVGIPTSQMGLRRKLKALHKIEQFSTSSVGDSEDEGSGDDGEEGEGSDADESDES